MPLVSVVIPTCNRPKEVQRAITSVLEQSVDLEVIVVVDGPQRQTESMLHSRYGSESGLRVCRLPCNRGPSAARNAGAALAQGRWVALLDDDDWWLPNKLQAQLEATHQSRSSSVIVSSRCRVETPHGTTVLPRRRPRPGVPLCRYLFPEDGLFTGDTLVATSTLLAPTQLFRRVPFDPGMRIHEDWSWLLRASRLQGARLQMLTEPLVVLDRRMTRPTTTPSVDSWRYSLLWIQQMRPFVTARAYASFVLTQVGSQAAGGQCGSAFFQLLIEAVQKGQPSLRRLLFFLAYWALVPAARRRVRNRLVGPGLDG